MRTFTYEPPPGRVVFGPGASGARLAEELRLLGAQRVLLVAERPFDAPGVPLVGTFADVRAHVPAAVARAATDVARDAQADWLLSVGGGFATGAAKAIALDLALPIAAVPTTYAGSEMTPIYGITDGRRKRTGTSPAVVPRLVVYDPDLLASLPAPLAAASAMNAMAHALEALYGPGANPLTSFVAEGAIRTLAAGLHSGDPATTLRGAYLAGTALAVAGTGLHHRICHVLGGAYDLPHAELHAVVLPHAAALLEPAHPEELARAAGALGAPDAAIALHELLVRLPGASSLAEIGFADGDLHDAADLLDAELGIGLAPARHILAGAHAGTAPQPLGRQARGRALSSNVSAAPSAETRR